ncbi:MAG TPA: tyrosine-type recombinase/integrase [Syntrophales bacterium]|nr:tyrosine-type recombinase/integrase [Syntrophales bacterium]
MKAGTTKEEARKELREIEAKIERRSFIHDKKVPLFSEVKKKWLEYKQSRCRETTWEMYQGYLRNHFSDLDGKQINRITTGTVESFITAKQGELLSLGTLRKVIVTLNQIMGYAVRHRLIDHNPVRDAERPRATGMQSEERAMKILAPDQIRALLEAEPNQKYRTLYLMAIMTGARQGEILGLKWSDVDFQKKRVHISRTYNHDRFFSPKTKGSIRAVDLSPFAVSALASWKLAAGATNDALVFPNNAGNPMDKGHMMRRHFNPALKAAGIEPIRFHDLRHTYASLMLAQGENVKYIQTQLGHSSPTVTLNVYSHLLKETNQDAVCRLENVIFEGTGHNLVTKQKEGKAVIS